jgi:hypothetical protein
MTPISRLLLAIALAAVPLVCLLPARAQDIMNIIRRDYERRQQGIVDSQKPARVMQAPQRRSRPRASPFAVPAPARTPATEAKPAVEPTIFVRVLGDSLAEMLADGIKRQFEDRPDIAVVPQTKSSSGFVRLDYFDWNAAIAELLASGQKIDAVVIMIGANDRQPLTDGANTYEPRSDEWRNAYAARIDAALATLKQKGLRTFWVGLPPMKNERLTADVVWFNEIYRERVERAGATYIDIWDGFVDVDGVYTATGPDLNGRVTKLRATDGVHFSKAGAQLAAHYVERDLRRALGDAPIAATPTATVPLIPGDTGRSAVSGVSVSTLGPDAILPEEAAPEKPEFGPVLPLEQVERSPGGVLLGGGQPSAPAAVASAGSPPNLPPATGDPTAAKVLVRGEALAPREGRADDFRWPRQPIASAPSNRAAGEADEQAVPRP